MEGNKCDECLMGCISPPQIGQMEEELNAQNKRHVLRGQVFNDATSAFFNLSCAKYRSLDIYC